MPRGNTTQEGRARVGEGDKPDRLFALCWARSHRTSLVSTIARIGTVQECSVICPVRRDTHRLARNDVARVGGMYVHTYILGDQK